MRHVFASTSGDPETGDVLSSVQEALLEGIIYSVCHADSSLKVLLHIICTQRKRKKVYKPDCCECTQFYVILETKQGWAWLVLVEENK